MFRRLGFVIIFCWLSLSGYSQGTPYEYGYPTGKTIFDLPLQLPETYRQRQVKKIEIRTTNDASGSGNASRTFKIGAEPVLIEEVELNRSGKILKLSSPFGEGGPHIEQFRYNKNGLLKEHRIGYLDEGDLKWWDSTFYKVNPKTRTHYFDRHFAHSSAPGVEYDIFRRISDHYGEGMKLLSKTWEYFTDPPVKDDFWAGTVNTDSCIYNSSGRLSRIDEWNFQPGIDLPKTKTDRATSWEYDEMGNIVRIIRNKGEKRILIKDYSWENGNLISIVESGVSDRSDGRLQKEVLSYYPDGLIRTVKGKFNPWWMDYPYLVDYRYEFFESEK